MPIREACHVAIQRSHPDKQKLWKHAQARQHNKGQGSTPVLQIVCSPELFQGKNHLKKYQILSFSFMQTVLSINEINLLECFN